MFEGGWESLLFVMMDKQSVFPLWLACRAAQAPAVFLLERQFKTARRCFRMA